MANLSVRIVDGKIVSYRIRVYRGRDKDGRQIKPYQTTFQVPEKLWYKPEKARKEAEKAAILFEEKCRIGEVSAEKKKFSDYAEYVMAFKERDKEHRTVHRYRDLLKRINEEIGHIRLDKLTCEHLNRFYFKLEEPGANKHTGGALSPKTIREHHRLIHVILAHAQKEGVLNQNVADNASPPKIHKKEVEIIELDEMKKIIELLNEEPLLWRTAVNLMLCTACRRGEIMGLHWRSVDFETSTVKIVDNMQYTPEKGVYITTPKSKKSRTIKVPEYVMNLLKELKTEQDKMKEILGDDWYDTGLCFVGDYGRRMHPDSITHWLNKFCKRHSLKHIHPHKFRHSTLSLLVSQKVDIATVSSVAGHSQISTTENIYIHPTTTGMDVAGSVVNNTLYENKNN